MIDRAALMLRLLTAVTTLDEPLPDNRVQVEDWFGNELNTVRKARNNITEQVPISDRQLSAVVSIAELLVEAAEARRTVSTRVED